MVTASLYSRKVQQPMRTTAALDRRPHMHWVGPADHYQGCASSLHPGGVPHPVPKRGGKRRSPTVIHGQPEQPANLGTCRLTPLKRPKQPGHFTPALRCRVEPYLDKTAPLRGAAPGVSAAAQPWGAARRTPGTCQQKHTNQGRCSSRSLVRRLVLQRHFVTMPVGARGRLCRGRRVGCCPGSFAARPR